MRMRYEKGPGAIFIQKTAVPRKYRPTGSAHANAGTKDNTHTQDATRHPHLLAPPHRALAFCAPHAHPLLVFVLIRVEFEPGCAFHVR